MTNLRLNSFLHRALLADAAATAATGLLLALGASGLSSPLGLSEALLRYAGLSLLPFAALVAWLARQPEPSRPVAWGVVAYNAVWAIDSVLILLLGWVSPTTLGYVFVVGQALVVALFAELQFFGLRRSGKHLEVTRA
jgi:hypothetical protein